MEEEENDLGLTPEEEQEAFNDWLEYEKTKNKKPIIKKPKFKTLKSFSNLKPKRRINLLWYYCDKWRNSLCNDYNNCGVLESCPKD